MIEFRIWLRQILRYCDFVASGGAWEAWVDHDYSRTSVTDFDELFEQLFDDLDSDAVLADLQKLIPDVLSRSAIIDFLTAIKAVDFELRPRLDTKDYKALLGSQQWNVARDAAQRAVVLFCR